MDVDDQVEHKRARDGQDSSMNQQQQQQQEVRTSACTDLSLLGYHVHLASRTPVGWLAGSSWHGVMDDRTACNVSLWPCKHGVITVAAHVDCC